MRTVNVKGESTVNSGRCTMERTSPWPRTVTLPKTTPTVGRRASTLEQRPGSAETPTLIPKETVQQLRVLLNPEHPLFGTLPYAELLACL